MGRHTFLILFPIVPVYAAILAHTGRFAAAAAIVEVGIAVDTTYIVAGADDALLL